MKGTAEGISAVLFFPFFMVKRIIIITYLALIIIMGAATIIEKYQGASFTTTHIYGAWWFSALWAVLTACGVVWLVRQKVRRWSIVTLHASLVITLLGALLTHLTSSEGIIHLREGERTDRYVSGMGTNEMQEKPLPFTVRLDLFDIEYHEGTQTAADYVSRLTVSTGKDSVTTAVSMNNVFKSKGVRLYQSSYDDDGHGSYLSVNIDPWGISTTYLGYALLFISLLWMLADPKGTFRRLLHSPVLNHKLTTLLLLTALHPLCLQAAKTLPHETADEFGHLYVLYNGRICQLQTYAIDFTKKLCGKSHYGDYSAEQVLTGFIFFGDEWSDEPLIKIKGGALKSQLQLPSHGSFNTFFRQGEYILGPLVEEFYRGQHDKIHKEAADYDDKLQLILQLRQGRPLKLFPFESKEEGVGLQWYAPTGKYPQDMEQERKEYMHNIFGILYQDALAGHHAHMSEAIDKMAGYQKRYGGMSVPSSLKTRAERIYNTIPFATILFMVNLSAAILSLFVWRPAHWVMWLSLAALTFCIALRWIISGSIPMSNGYETMLLTAWLIEVLGLISCRKFPIMLTFGLLMSGFFLLVSHIGQMNPEITHIMPVLNSPLLSIHVSVIMMAYALLSITFICGVVGLLMPRKAEYLHVLSQIFLHPSLTALGIGIFTGAIWANVSWGTYWSWDPKEVWALITLMVYAIGVHQRSLPFLRKARNYHLFMVVAFLTLLMTYFGVNYFLGGMHSYA